MGSDFPFFRGKFESKMSEVENASDAQTKYFEPDPLLRHMEACYWVPVDGGL